jgi:hypothetical protein
MRVIALALLGCLAAVVRAGGSECVTVRDWLSVQFCVDTTPQVRGGADCFDNATHWMPAVESCISTDAQATGFPYDVPFANSSSVMAKLRSNVVAWAQYNSTANASGWDLLEITAPAAVHLDSPTAAYWAGYLEGYLTRDRLWASYYNAELEGNIDFRVADWIEKQLHYVHDMIDKSKQNVNTNEPGFDLQQYWEHVEGQLRQISGLSDGYNAGRVHDLTALPTTVCAKVPGGCLPIDFMNMLYLNMETELGSIMSSIEAQTGEISSSSSTRPRNHLVHADRCSALVKVAEDDLFFSHTSWSPFNVMLRTYKVYNLGGATVAFSGYPGCVSSMDDWYMTSPQLLAVTETSISNSNASIYAYNTPHSVPNFARCMVACFLAESAEQWVTIMKYNNSGSYNNEWLIADMKIVNMTAPTIETKLPAGSFWVYDQTPGPFSYGADVTTQLRETRYFASYNEPYFEEVRSISNFSFWAEHCGVEFSYHKYARAMIFERDQSSITDMTSLHSVMRYNNYTTEPFSRLPYCEKMPEGVCSPPYSAMLAISSRGDLDPVDTSLMGLYGDSNSICDFVGQQQNAGIDNKATSWKWMTQQGGRLRATIVSGPTTSGGLPVFDWSPPSLFNGTPTMLLPSRFDFPYLDVSARR